MDTLYKKAVTGIVVVSFLILLQLIFIFLQKKIERQEKLDTDIKNVPHLFRATLLAFGDINLGRKVGTRIFNGEINHPFEKINLRADSADIVFANLESPLSDQKGVTVDPKNNLIFTGPSQAAKSLANAGITLVSTANNHALDFGPKALLETIAELQKENILHVGTAKKRETLFDPLIIEKNNIKFAIFGVTSSVNFSPKNWRDIVASADTVELLKQIERCRESVDFLILSYHGGVEYTNKPVRTAVNFAEWCLRNGVDLVLGHHPHVTFGITRVNGKIIVHSLGNFVFNQPQQYWTRRSYGIKFFFAKSDTGKSVGIEKILPLNVGRQTERLTDSTEYKKLLARTNKLSNFDVSLYWK